ncbi:MAG: hypothetical protein LBR10_00325 [Prevotellaceae bacterium]|jgi:hypothetical protein|nr:hypothetical protein [Prevotellaceae bacterium]
MRLERDNPDVTEVVLFGKLGRNKVFILRQENNHDHIKIEYSAKNYINFGNKILTGGVTQIAFLSISGKIARIVIWRLQFQDTGKLARLDNIP